MSSYVDNLMAANAVGSAPRDWSAHPSFAGVELCTLVGPKASGNRIKVLLVHLAPRAEMRPHRHEREFEMHQVLDGAGELNLGGTRQYYRPGGIGLISPNVEHGVTAADEGLWLLATFVPTRE